MPRARPLAPGRRRRVGPILLLLLLAVTQTGCGGPAPAPAPAAGRSPFSYDDDEIDPAHRKPARGSPGTRARK
jgi:hypothetical protein